MAKGNTLRGKFTGRIGEDVFYVRDGEQIVKSYTPGSMIKDPKTPEQMAVRTRWANIINMYKSFNGTLKDCFETKRRGQSDYNRFVSMNMQMPPVFLTRQEVEMGVCIAADYYISQGSLPSIGVTGTDETAYTNISLGDLKIDETTTIAQFARAVVEHNVEYNYYDQISYFSALQLTSPDGMPYVRGTQTRVNLNPTDTTTLLSIAPSYGFSTTDGFLGHGEYVGQGAFGWVHSRRSSNRVLVSSQQLIANNALLPQYTSSVAEEEAMQSYGVKAGIFIKPDKLSGGSGNTEQVTVPPTVNIVNIDGKARQPGDPRFACGPTVAIHLTGNNLNAITNLQLAYAAGSHQSATTTVDATIAAGATPTQLEATVEVPAGSYCDRLIADGVEIIAFSQEAPDPAA